MDPALIAAAASAAGSVLFLIIILAFIAFVCKSTKNHDYRRRLRHHQTRTVANLELSSVTMDESASYDPTINHISIEELKVSTKNFSTDLIIGDGSFGLVYKATLYNGSTVAIKKLDPDAFQGFREFRAEMETLGELRHGNIVKILGYCVSDRDRVMEKKDMGFIQWAKKMLGQDRHMEMLDCKMPKEGLIGDDQVKEYFRIASLCTEEFMVDRPAMSEVVDLLKKLSA
uniref:Protein kinase domain-containing protein n=1 Tax=Populus alba TaxID=43335 RepID=A0A4U5Q0V3_POPAL|nr:hypothetical protein D5086_0000156310 [Populus alba]